MLSFVVSGMNNKNEHGFGGFAWRGLCSVLDIWAWRWLVCSQHISAAGTRTRVSEQFLNDKHVGML